jgi:Axonemal dynein light chain
MKISLLTFHQSSDYKTIFQIFLFLTHSSEDGQLWCQTVSSTPATRQDVINLQEMLDTRLQQSQARETGICPIRRELYSQAFGEFKTN